MIFISGKEVEREDIASWLRSDETKLYIEKLKQEKEEVLGAMLNLTSFGEEMMKDYYQLKGSALGLEAAHALMINMVTGDK